MHHLYLSHQPSIEALSSERSSLEGWCANRGITEYKFIEENLLGERPQEKDIEALYADIQPGDTVVTPSLSRLGRSLNMAVSALRIIHSAGATLVCIAENKEYPSTKATAAWISTLEYAVKLSSDIRMERSNEAFYISKSKGTTLGRPRGAKKNPEKLVLYGKEETVRKMLACGKNISHIAKKTGVARATIYNYITANGLPLPDSHPSRQK